MSPTSRQGSLEQPLNAVIVHAGDGQQAAVDIGAGIFMSRDVSNVYLVTTSDGDLLVNTGMPGRGDEHRRRFAEVSSNPVKVITFTQSHPDHIGGWSTFTGPEVTTIAQARYAQVRGYWRGLEPFYLARTGRLWSRDINAGQAPAIYPDPVLDRSFHDRESFVLGDRRIELLAVPGGETHDALVVWLPDDRVVFTGNLTGPIFGHVPNLYTVRGDKLRSVASFVECVQRVIDLAPAVLVTGHGDPLVGEEEIRQQLSRIRDAAQYLWDRTWEGMNAGVDLWTLMDEIELPPALALPQGHGKVPWIVRAIWEEHAGWFRYESSTELYSVPVKAVAPDIVHLAGGPDPLMERAAHHLAEGRPLHALQLTDLVLDTDAGHRGALTVKLAATEALLAASGRENFSEVRWLEAEIRDTQAALDDPAGDA